VKSITLEQLITLNREISALAAAGVPLPEGLMRVADDLSGRTSALSRRLAERMESGQDLAAALDAEGDSLPQSYRALVDAGCRSGRLTSALEGYTQAVERLAELRHVVGLALLYPVLLLVTTWIFFVFASSVILPSFDWLEIGDQIWVEPLRFAALRPGHGRRWVLAVMVPLVLITAVWIWWRSMSASTSASAEASVAGPRKRLDWIPGITQVIRLSCQANFAYLLRLFVDQQIPLTEALPLAASASGLTDAARASRKLAGQIATGQSLRANPQALRELPPLVRLALLTNRGPAALAISLQRAADSYYDRAASLAGGIAFYLPIAATTLVGGTSVGIYAVLLLQPYVATLQHVLSW